MKKNRLIVDIYWCALSATWCCNTFTIIHAQNIVVQKNFVRADPPLYPPLMLCYLQESIDSCLSSKLDSLYTHKCSLTIEHVIIAKTLHRVMSENTWLHGGDGLSPLAPDKLRP